MRLGACITDGAHGFRPFHLVEGFEQPLRFTQNLVVESGQFLQERREVRAFFLERPTYVFV
jgi:hypothetical protein